MIGVKKDQNGLSLMEVVVASGLFSVLMMSMISFFLYVNSAQRSAIASQETQESLRYLMEVISKEMRLARRSQDDTCRLAGYDPRVFRIFNTHSGGADSDILYFLNKNGECVYYYLDDGRFMVRRQNDDLPATPDELTVSDLRFEVSDNVLAVLPQHRIQPWVTISFIAEADRGRAEEKQPVRMQTSVSTRFYE